MKAQQDIEQQLAAAQDAWETPPAPELWDRLEQRLDAQAPTQAPSVPRRWPFRIVMIALLAVVGAGIWWMLPQGNAATSKGKPFAAHTVVFDTERALFAAANSGNQDLEEATLDAKEESRMGVLAQAKDPNVVGVVGKTLYLPNGTTSGASPSTNTAMAQINFNPTVASLQNMNYNNPAGGNMYNGNPTMDNRIAQLPAGNMLVTNGFGNPIDTVSSLQQFRNFPTVQGNAYLQLNAATNVSNFNYVAPVALNVETQRNLQHLKWLLGSWKTQGSSGGAFEEWRQKDDFTLVGRGYFVVNGDTIVTEEMRIEQRGPDVYYIIAKDQNNKSMKFRLRSRMPNELIFQNDAPKAANELVLRNRVGTNEVERVIQPQGNVGNTSNEPHPPAESRVMKRKQSP